MLKSTQFLAFFMTFCQTQKTLQNLQKGDFNENPSHTRTKSKSIRTPRP